MSAPTPAGTRSAFRFATTAVGCVHAREGQLFTEFEGALAGRHPFPVDKLALLATLGAALLQSVKPGNAPTAAVKRSPESILRDQFAALVADRYDQLQVLAAVALGHRKANELLPALRSTAAVVSEASATTNAEPAGSDARPA